MATVSNKYIKNSRNTKHKIVELKLELDRAKAFAQAAELSGHIYSITELNEIHTPLVTIIGLTEIIEEEIHAGRLEEALRYNKMLRDNGKTLVELLQSKITTSKELVNLALTPPLSEQTVL